MKDLLPLCLISLCPVGLLAEIEVSTSISDVYNRGESELTGALTLTVFCQLRQDRLKFPPETLSHEIEIF